MQLSACPGHPFAVSAAMRAKTSHVQNVSEFLYTLSMAQKTMTQTQIVKAMAEACEVSSAKARQVLTFLSDTAIKEVKKNGLFVVPGLGRLVRVERKARLGRNPATGETIKIAAKKVVKFRIAKSAKDAIVPPKVKK